MVIMCAYTLHVSIHLLQLPRVFTGVCQTSLSTTGSVITTEGRDSLTRDKTRTPHHKTALILSRVHERNLDLTMSMSGVMV